MEELKGEEYRRLEERNLKATTSLLSGAIGGICLVGVGHPFDLVKVRLQTSTQFSTMSEAFRILFRREGLAGIYRGASAPLVGVAPIFAISIWGFDTGLQLSQLVTPNNSNRLDVKNVLFAGAFSALPTTILQVPGDRVKLVLQMSNSPIHQNPISKIKQIYRDGGLKSLYRGYCITLAKEIPGSAIYFTNYEYGKSFLSKMFKKHEENFVIKAFDSAQTNRDKLNHPLAILLAGGFAGTMNGLITLPIDVIKSRFQSAPEGAFSSSWQVFEKLIISEGFKSLFRGLVPVLVRAFPANAACFGGIEVTRHVCNLIEGRLKLE